MIRFIVFQLFLLFITTSLFECAKERNLRLTVNDSPVTRGTAYIEAASKLSCYAPEGESAANYQELAIRKGKDVICKASQRSSECTYSATPTPVLSQYIKGDGNYSCEFQKTLEPPVKPSNVTVYMANDKIKVYDEEGNLRSDSLLRPTNETSFRLVCPEAPSSVNATKVIWKKNDQTLKEHKSLYTVNETTQNLVFHTKNVKTLDTSKYGGWYKCERIRDSDKTVLLTAFLKVNGAPHASPVQKSYSKMEDDSVTMSCHIEGEPVPTVTWERKDGKSISTPDIAKRVSFSEYEGIPNASMTISSLVPEDYAEYACKAEGGGMESEGIILLRVRSKLAALWPFLGIVAEVIVLVAIIFIYEKRRSKKEQEENEDTADQKKSLTASNNENKEIRQRKA